MNRSLLALFVTLCVSCASAKVHSDQLSSAPTDLKVRLGEVAFEGVTEEQAKWEAIIRTAFEEQAAEEGIAGGSTPVNIRVLSIDPGSQALRYWVGFGAGTGSIDTAFTVSNLGEFGVRGKVSAGFWGGSFEKVCKKLGSVAAEHIASKRSNP